MMRDAVANDRVPAYARADKAVCGLAGVQVWSRLRTHGPVGRTAALLLLVLTVRCQP